MPDSRVLGESCETHLKQKELLQEFMDSKLDNFVKKREVFVKNNNMCPSAHHKKEKQYELRKQSINNEDKSSLNEISETLSRINRSHQNIRKELASVKKSLNNKVKQTENVFKMVSSDAKELSKMIEIVRYLTERMEVQRARRTLNEEDVENNKDNADDNRYLEAKLDN